MIAACLCHQYTTVSYYINNCRFLVAKFYYRLWQHLRHNFHLLKTLRFSQPEKKICLSLPNIFIRIDLDSSQTCTFIPWKCAAVLHYLARHVVGAPLFIVLHDPAPPWAHGHICGQLCLPLHEAAAVFVFLYFQSNSSRSSLCVPLSAVLAGRSQP